jgi:hypothetical protein
MPSAFAAAHKTCRILGETFESLRDIRRGSTVPVDLPIAGCRLLAHAGRLRPDRRTEGRPHAYATFAVRR